MHIQLDTFHAQLMFILVAFFHIVGRCACGSIMRCQFSGSDHARVVKVMCVLEPGDEKCGKRQLRGETRVKIGKELEQKSAFAYRNEEATKAVDEGNEEPQRVYSIATLRKIKQEQKLTQYLDVDPIKSLALMKRKSTFGNNVIHDISYDPFSVQFWSSHQVRVYNEKVTEDGASLSIDATGKVAPKVIHVDGNKSKHLFLYTSVLNCKAGPFPVQRQITESHDAVSIAAWLKKWLSSGAKYPSEVVSIYMISFLVNTKNYLK